MTVLALCALPAGKARAQGGDELRVVIVVPAARALDAAPGSSIRVRFDRPAEASSVDGRSFWAFGRWSAAAAGSFGSRRAAGG